MTAPTATHATMTNYGDRAAWLAARRKGLGGSDATAVLGVSRWRSPLEVWSEKVGLVPVEDPAEVPLRIRLGNELEPVVAKILGEESRLTVERATLAIVAHPEHPELLFSPDGFVVGEDRQYVGLIELKTQDIARAEEWAEGVPEEYRIQIQHGLMVTGLPFALVGCLIGTRDFRWARVERDDAFIAEMRTRLLDFWALVVAETPPAPTGAEGDTRALNALYPAPASGKVVPLGPDALERTWELAKIREEQKRLDERETELKNLIRAELGDAEEGVLPGGEGSWRWKVEKRKGFTVDPSESRVLRQSKGRR